MKRLVLNGSEHTDGCFPAVLFQTQRASVSVQCGGCTAVGGGNVTHRTYLHAHKREKNSIATSLLLPFQASAHMDLDFKNFDSERLIIEAKKDRHCKIDGLISIWV
jgi:hypothetical protein